LTPDGQDVTDFDRAKDTFVLTAATPTDESQLYQSAGPTVPPDIQVGTGMSLFTLLYPLWEQSVFGLRPQQIWTVRNGKAAPVLQASTSLPVSLTASSYSAVLSLSPSGLYAIVANIVSHVPTTWESYEARFRFAKILADKPNATPTVDSLASRPVQYELVDLQTGKTSALVDAPSGASAFFADTLRALWSKNGREVIVTNTFLPLEGASANNPLHSRRPWVVAVDIRSRKITCIKEASLNKDERSRPRLIGLEWKVDGQQLLLRYFDDHSRTILEPELFWKKSPTWRAVTDPVAIRAAAKTSEDRELSIYVHQGVNEPPVLMATATTTGVSRQIWDPNPQFAAINLGEAAVLKWQDDAGHEWLGGLVKPPDYVPGHRYPLVIQTHGFNWTEFLTDGFAPTAMAARPMAARGMMVLQVQEITVSPDDLTTPRESTTMRQGYVAAIKYLDDEGLIDPQKVGIVGFSRTGWYVLDSLIHQTKYFAAATLANCTYISFGEYLLNADFEGPGRAESIAAAIGSKPFGAGLEKWISNSSGFNTDNIGVPILFEANSPVELIYAWDIYAALRLQEKPVELLYFRNGSHVLIKPLERLASEEMTVDWYDFWLNGHEDISDPNKAEQYGRWKRLKNLRDKNQNARFRSTSQ
jgi:dipeptidyl aminopeptidase/acylaminoacyl peptidase